MVFLIFNNATNRITVYMHIDGRHKNGNLNAPVFKKFGLFSFFNYHYFPVSWTYYMSVFLRNINSRASEELKYDYKNEKRKNVRGPVEPVSIRIKKLNQGV